MQKLRLINANALKESLKELKIVGNDTNNDIRYIQGFQDAVDDYFPQIIDDTPTINAVSMKLNDAIDCIHDFCKARKGKCIDCPAYVTFRIESGDTVQTCKFRCDAPVNWKHIDIGGADK